MEHYAGLDVSLELTSVCVVDGQGRVLREAKVASEPDALIRFLADEGVAIARVGLEAGPLSQWLHAGLVMAGVETVLLETRHVKAALSAMTVKTDRRDARGIAQLLRLGWYRPVHAKSASAQEVRSLLTARKLIQGKLLDIESGIRGVLRGFGLKVGPISRGRFETRIRELVSRAGHSRDSDRLDAERTHGPTDRVLPSPPLASGACARRSGLSAADECAWRRCRRRHHLQERGR